MNYFHESKETKCRMCTWIFLVRQKSPHTWHTTLLENLKQQTFLQVSIKTYTEKNTFIKLKKQNAVCAYEFSWLAKKSLKENSKKKMKISVTISNWQPKYKFSFRVQNSWNEIWKPAFQKYFLQ